MPTTLELEKPRRRMTLAEFLALPDDGVERMLIDGEVWEDEEVSYRSRKHSRATTLVATELELWLRRQPNPHGSVLTGDAGAVLDADNVVGIDVAYFSAAVMAEQDDDESTVVVGVPELAVEILSPADTNRKRDAKLKKYRQAGAPLVWLLDPELRTVTAHRPGADPVMFSGRQPVTAPDVLPGFAVPAADLFG